jgi:hypothetical protein
LAYRVGPLRRSEAFAPWEALFSKAVRHNFRYVLVPLPRSPDHVRRSDARPAEFAPKSRFPLTIPFEVP